MLPKRSLTWLRGASARAGTSPASLLAALVAAVLLLFVGVPLVVVREDTVQPMSKATATAYRNQAIIHYVQARRVIF